MLTTLELREGAATPRHRPPGTRTAVLFHAYEWDAFTERQAAALAARSCGLDFYVVADETSGALPVRGYRKIAHTQQTFAAQGLPVQQGLWWNLDYALYHAVEALPDYEFFLRFDPDMRVTVELAAVAARMRLVGADWMTLPLRGVQGWVFRNSAEALPYRRRAYVPLMATLLSAAAVRRLAAERKALAAAHAADQPWAFCECFVASALIACGARRTLIDTLADTSLFKAEFAMLETDPRLRRPGCLFHAVLDVPRLRRKLDRVTLYLVRRGHDVELRRLCRCADRNGFSALYEAALSRARANAGPMQATGQRLGSMTSGTAVETS